jgi:PIN domain nuclease of toxin-antitoxin system
VIVLDTHVWIWLADDPRRLSPAAREAIDSVDAVGVSAISCWEVGMLALGGRLTLDREPSRWVRQALGRPGLVALPVEPKLALDAAMLERQRFVGPADRLIYATARDAGASMVTRDARIRGFDPRGTLW